jgi:FtsP/CotA-like multicopper oxidase with cupredoxin domain
MVSRTQRLVFLGIAVVVGIVAVVLVTSSGGSESGFTKDEVTLSAEHPQTIKVHQGDDVKFKVTSAKADEAHLHGYDIHKDVPAGGTVEFALKAANTGIFEIELENAGAPLGELRVEPK